MNNWLKKSVATTLAVALVVPLTLTGCADDPNRQGEAVGEVAGTIVGILAGSRVGQGQGKLVAVAAGAIIGMYAGRALGHKFDLADQQMAENAQREAMDKPIKETVTWNNPDSGNSGTITPVRDGTNEKTGESCREFETTVTVDGQLERATGTACKQADGSWRIVQ